MGAGNSSAKQPSSPDIRELISLYHAFVLPKLTAACLRQYLALEPIPTILSCLSPSTNSAGTRSKAMYALSGLLKHNAVAVEKFTEFQGWHALRGTLEGEPSLDCLAEPRHYSV